MAIKSFPFFVSALMWCTFNAIVEGAGQDEKNPQKIKKPTCNLEKTVYSMSSYREFPINHTTKEIRL